MHFIFAFSLLCLLIQSINGLPYSSMNDLYDTNYEYEFGENQAREEVFITQTPAFLSQPLDMVVNEGHTVRLPCLVDRLDGFVLLWRKNNQIISVGSQIIDKSDSKLQLDEDENGNTLVIQQADHTDEAEYICSVSAYRKTELKHNIRIRVQPVISTSPQESLMVNEGDSATLSCQLQLGTPMPKLKWRKCEGGTILSGEDGLLENVLKFASVTQDDSGCYVCEADNGFAEEPVTSKVMLVVEYPPSIKIQKTEDASDLTTVTCMVESVPEAEVTWLKDGEKLDDANQRIIVNKKTLQLVDFDEEYYGSYTCKAKNKLGSDEKSVQISGKESDADSFGNIGDSKEKDSQHKPSKEEGYKTSFHESETLIQDNVIGIGINRPRKSSGKIYFARVPSLYTLPDKEIYPVPKTQSYFFESRPRNVNEFLKLLRIYHQAHALGDEIDSIYNEDNLTPEHTTDNKLLRSTHSYVGHLNTQLKPETVIDRDQVNEMSFITSQQETNIKDQSDSEVKEPTSDEKKITYEDVQPKKEQNLNKKGIENTKPKLTNLERSSIKGKYLEENEILTDNASIKDPIDTDLLYTSNASAMLRGHHAKEINMENVEAEDVFAQLDKKQKTHQENKSIDNVFDEIYEEKILHDYIKNEVPKVKTESQQKETEMDKTSDWFSTGNIGTRYLDGSQIKDIEDDKTVEQNGINIPVFRGQHLLQTTLQNIDMDEEYTVMEFERKRKLQEPQMKTDYFDDKIYLKNRHGDYSKDAETLEMTGPERKNNDANLILTNSRYIEEDQIKEDMVETPQDKIETKSKVLRGHHSIQSNLAETDEGDLEISSSNLGMNAYLGSSLDKDNHEQLKSQTQTNTHNEKEKSFGAKETMYPKEIMNIEKKFFTKLSNFDLTNSEVIDPRLPPKEEVQLEGTSKLDEDDENDVTRHPLQLPTAQVYTETKIQFRGNHMYGKGLKNVNSETMIGKNDDKMSSEWSKLGSKPLRGDHSYNHKIGHIKNKDGEDDNGKKQTKRRLGPHPFRGLRLRMP